MSDPTRFDLDERQRAMLAEMGVRVWWRVMFKLWRQQVRKNRLACRAPQPRQSSPCPLCRCQPNAPHRVSLWRKCQLRCRPLLKLL